MYRISFPGKVQPVLHTKYAYTGCTLGYLINKKECVTYIKTYQHKDVTQYTHTRTNKYTTVPFRSKHNAVGI